MSSTPKSPKVSKDRKKEVVWKMTRITGGGWTIDGIIGVRRYNNINKRACRLRYISEWKALNRYLTTL